MGTSVTMEFEKPIVELEKQIEELKKTADKRQLSVDVEIAPLERRLAELDAWLAPYRRLWNASLDALGDRLDRLDDPSGGRPGAGATERGEP